MTSYCTLKTSRLGELILVANPKQLTGIFFSDCEHAPSMPGDWALNPKHPVLQRARRQLEEYLDGARKRFSLSHQCDGTAFQREIWRQISLIPFGQTITYSELAQRAGHPKATRAAGSATGKNPLGIVVPCHRVVGKHGKPGGYAGGLERKMRLLEIETVEIGKRRAAR